MKSTLARFMPESMNCYKIKHDAWHDEKILVITPQQMKRLTESECELLKRIGTKLYD